MKRFTGQRMIEIHHDDIVLHFQYGAIHTISVRTHHRYGFALFDMLAVKFAVNLEDMFRQFHHMILVSFAVCLLGGKRKVECIPSCQTAQMIFKVFQHHPGSENEL